MVTVYLGLGSNLGNRALYIKKAVQRLRENRIAITKLSTVIETDPVGGPKQGKYLNAALKAKTNLSPQNLLKTLKSIEKELGRKRGIRYGPRTIDIDILLYSRKTVNAPKLTIPHPRMIMRDFVMIPLNEIAPSITKKLGYEYHKNRHGHAQCFRYFAEEAQNDRLRPNHGLSP